MFIGTGEYYCINGCFKYPVDMGAIIRFLNELPKTSGFDEITCYDIQPDLFSYVAAMEDEYPITKSDLLSLSAKVLLRMDFYYFDLSCQLQMEPFDETYYGLSLVYRYDDRVIDERLWVLKETFYRNLKPIYGNDGHEKGAFSIKQINKTDYDLFNNNFYISQTVLKKMGIQSSRLKEVKTIDGCGIYCPIQDETTSKLVFTAFFKATR